MGFFNCQTCGAQMHLKLINPAEPPQEVFCLKCFKMNEQQILDECDPGIRDTVKLLREAGFKTCDSGDGSKVDWMEGALPYPHVVATTTQEKFFAEVDRMASVLGDPWIVEGSYSSVDGVCVLFASRDSHA